MNRRIEQSGGNLRPVVQEIGDQAVTFAGLEYIAAQNRPIKLNPQTRIPIASSARDHEDALLNLALASHGRAQSESDAYTLANRLSWVRFAQAGIVRASEYTEAAKGLEKAKTFTDESFRDQLEIYDEMQRRMEVVRGGPIEDNGPLEFALRVITKEIIIGPWG